METISSRDGLESLPNRDDERSEVVCVVEFRHELVEVSDWWHTVSD